MTINESSERLLNFFLENHVYDPDTSFNKVVLISEDPALDKAILQEGLNILEKGLIISKIPKKNEDGSTRDIYVLNNNLLNLKQTVEIDGPVAGHICFVLNQWAEILEDENMCASPLKLTQGDIHNLISIIDILHDNQDDGEDGCGDPECENCNPPEGSSEDE